MITFSTQPRFGGQALGDAADAAQRIAALVEHGKPVPDDLRRQAEGVGASQEPKPLSPTRRR